MAADLHTVLSLETLRRHRAVPLALSGASLTLGFASDPGPATLRELSFLAGRRIVPVHVEDEAVAAYLTSADERDGGRTVAPPAVAPTPEARGSAVDLVDGLLREAVASGASDVHFEPYEQAFRVRFRRDGLLRTAAEPPLHLRDAVVSRVKILAGLDIAEKRRPQDGRLRLRDAGATVDLRVSTLPTDFGEKVVLRVLDRRRLALDLDALGFPMDVLACLRETLGRPHGLLLVTGPTGSGKTTTLYAALAAVAGEGLNLVTIEDPIEYHLAGVNQTQVRADLGYTFANALRAFLRQDPDVVMVGEIRDAETAAMALRAALTGHRVLSTLHTNDTPSALTRLTDLGAAPFLVSSAVRLVLAQRLVRRLCPHCRVEAAPSPSLRKAFGLGEDGGPFFDAPGCEACDGTGRTGRIALFEALPMTPALAALLHERAASSTEAAARARLRTLREDGLSRAREGLVGLADVLRETI